MITLQKLGFSRHSVIFLSTLWFASSALLSSRHKAFLVQRNFRLCLIFSIFLCLIEQSLFCFLANWETELLRPISTLCVVERGGGVIGSSEWVDLHPASVKILINYWYP